MSDGGKATNKKTIKMSGGSSAGMMGINDAEIINDAAGTITPKIVMLRIMVRLV